MTDSGDRSEALSSLATAVDELQAAIRRLEITLRSSRSRLRRKLEDQMRAERVRRVEASERIEAAAATLDRIAYEASR